MGSTLTASAIDKLLKDRYPEDSEVWAQFNTGAPALDLLTKGGAIPKYASMDAEGRQLRIPIRTAGNPNAAMPVQESKGYPTTGNQTYDEAVYTISTFVSSFQFSGLARKKAPGGAKSVRNAIELEMEAQMENARQRLNRALHSNGSGLFATCASASGNVITLAAVSAGSQAEAVPVGRELHVLNKTTGAFCGGHPAAASALVISAIDFSNTSAPTVTVTNEDGTLPTLTGVSSSFGLYAREAQGKDLYGFGVMCADTNPTDWGATAYYGGINRTSTTHFWSGYRLNAASATVSIQRHIQKILARIDARIGAKFGGKLFGFSGYDNFYAVCNSLARNQRTNYSMKLKGGYDGAQYNNCIFVIDFQAPVTAIRFINPKTVYRYVMDEWYWEDEMGGLERVSTSTGRPTNTFRKNMLTRQQLVSVQCLTNAELYGTSATA